MAGVSESGEIEINLSKEPYSGEYDIIEPVSNLEVRVIGNPHDMCDLKYEVVPEKQTEFTVARLYLLATNPQKILDNPEYFTVFPKDDWIELAEKAVQKEGNDIIKSLKKKY